MITLFEAPTIVKAAGNKPKQIEAFIAICLPAFSPQNVHRDPP
jgi:hypothetical protein